MTTDSASPTLSRKPLELTLAALALGFAVDMLFHGHAIGISFPIWAALSLATLLLSARWEGLRPARTQLLLIPPILFTSALVAVRLEPMTVFLSVLATLLLFGLLVRSLRHDRLLRFGWLDYIASWIAVPLEAVARPWSSLAETLRRLIGDRAARSRWFAVVRGLLLALPVLAVFVALLAAADLVFEDFIEDLLAWLDIEWIREAIVRVLIISISGIFFLGALVTAVRERPPRDLIGEDRPLLRPFIGFTETVVVLGLVDLVFAVFVVIQFRYLFGGEANITAAGYTYAEYARRGFGELVWAAFLSLGLILGLTQVGHREDGRQRSTFIGLSTGLAGLLLITLVSALKRLLLYENAFGFTRSRTYAHVFIYWLGALLLAFLVLLFREQMRRFAPASAIGALGFIVTLGLMNVDGFISAQNMARSGELDVQYLSELTADSVPSLAASAGEDSPPELLAHLACRKAILGDQLEGSGWQSYHFGRARALRSLNEIEALLEPYQVTGDQMTWMVEGPEFEEDYC
jgi:hypothetical protein